MLLYNQFTYFLKFWIVLICSLPINCVTLHGQSNNIDVESLRGDLSNYIKKEMTKNNIPGVVLTMVLENNIAISEGFGMSNIATKQLVNHKSTIFRMGSISKVFTAMAIMQLVDKGVLNLDTPVNNYFEEPLFEEKNHPILVRHLLNHSSGFDQLGYSRRVSNPSIRPSMKSFIKNNSKIIRTPGEIGNYDTYGITLAGYLIEVVSGISYSDYMRKNLFEPLGMSNTYVETPANKRNNLAIGYGYSNNSLVPLPYEWYVTLPASSVDATGADMGQFMIALLNKGKNSDGRLFSTKTAKQIFEPQYQIGERVHSFTYGFWEGSANGIRSVEHGGAMSGFMTQMLLIPELNAGFFIGYNQDPEIGPGADLRNRINEIFIDHLVREDIRPEVREPLVGIDTKKFEGNYVSNLGCFTCQAGTGWGIQLSKVKSVGAGLINLWGRDWVAIDSTTFQYKDGKTRLGFVLDRRGDIEYLVYRNYSYSKITDDLVQATIGQTSGLQTQLERLLIENDIAYSKNQRTSNEIAMTLITDTEVYIERASTGGISWIDFDNDGDDDIFVTNGYDVSNSPAVPQTNWLYENKNGVFVRLENILSEIEGFSSGSAWADFDNDGDLDLFVPNQRNQNNFLFQNNGSKGFTYLENAAPCNGEGLSFASTWADVDQDGFVDLFVANGGLSGRQQDYFYKNINGESFDFIQNILTKDSANTCGPSFIDYDNDGDLDLYLGGSPIKIFQNDGSGQFEQDMSVAFIQEPIYSGNSMSGAWGDFDNDGDLDLFQPISRGEPNRMFENLGNGKFQRVYIGNATSDRSSAFYSLWADLDNDSFLDLVVANWGAPPLIYMNKGGKSLNRVELASTQDRSWYASMVAASDFDKDGDIDLIVGNWPGSPGDGESNLLYRNDFSTGNWIGIRLKGTKSNAMAIGAKVEVKVTIDGNNRTITRDLRSQDGWRSQGSQELIFGIGQAQKVDAIKIYWPSGLIQEYGRVKTGERLIIQEPMDKK